MNEALAVHRLQFAFTITYHYLFPQLTMGLALLLVIWKVQAFRKGDERSAEAVRFWGRIFAINYVMGVVTGIPMEFQFGTNWAELSRVAGGVIGQTLAMEAVLAFFLESTFVGLFLFGERRLGPRGHLIACVLVLAGAWLSGYFIVVTNAWMQHPVGCRLGADGEILLTSLGAMLLNPWALWQVAHTMSGAVITACFVVAGVGAFYLLTKRHQACARIFVRTGVTVGLVASLLQLFPTGDRHGKLIAFNQPITLAAMEGLFTTQRGAPLAIIGQPDVEKRRLDNPVLVPRMLSFLTYLHWDAEVRGLDAYPEEDWPENIPLLYYSYHIMVGLGTLFIAMMAGSAWLLWKGRLFVSRWMLWVLMLSLPFPYIANTAGWLTAELGRQPWLVYGLLRTRDGFSMNVSAGNAMFTLMGFMGLYALLTILFLFLVYRELDSGPRPAGRSLQAAHYAGG